MSGYPHFNPEYERPVARGDSGPWQQEHEYYHRMKGRWVEIQNVLHRQSSAWWTEYREHFEAQRGAGQLLADNKLKVIREYALAHGLRTMVETGTFHGDTSWALKDEFDRIYTIEIEDDLFRSALEKFQGTNVIPFYGDSSLVLSSITRLLDGPTLFWIDAHFCGIEDAPPDRMSPVRAELELLFSLPPEHVILVDDARYFWPGSERKTELEGYPDHVWLRDAASQGSYEFAVHHDIVRLVPRV